MLSLLWTALIGLIIGAVAKLIMPGKDPGGIWITMLLGIAGSFLRQLAGAASGLVSGRSVRWIHHVGRRRADLARHLPFHQTQDCVANARFTPVRRILDKRAEARKEGPVGRRSTVPGLSQVMQREIVSSSAAKV